MIATLAEATAGLDLEQADMVQWFVEGQTVPQIAQRTARTEEATREALGEAFHWISRRIKGRVIREGRGWREE